MDAVRCSGDYLVLSLCKGITVSVDGWLPTSDEPAVLTSVSDMGPTLRVSPTLRTLIRDSCRCNAM